MTNSTLFWGRAFLTLMVGVVLTDMVSYRFIPCTADIWKYANNTLTRSSYALTNTWQISSHDDPPVLQ